LERIAIKVGGVTMTGTNNLHPLKLDELKGRPPSEVAALLEAELERGLSQEEAERC
jgi:hypothetical protein